jgi:uncharacterized protein (DUF169 family)
MFKDYSKMAQLLVECLQLRQAPIAVSFIDSIPGGISSHVGRVPAGCRFWEDASTAAFVTSVADHEMCAIGVYTHNLQPSPAQQIDLEDALGVFSDLGYVRGEDLPSIPVLQSRHNTCSTVPWQKLL